MIANFGYTYVARLKLSSQYYLKFISDYFLYNHKTVNLYNFIKAFSTNPVNVPEIRNAYYSPDDYRYNNFFTYDDFIRLVSDNSDLGYNLIKSMLAVIQVLHLNETC